MVSHGVISMTTINPTELCCQSCWVPREPVAKKPVTVDALRNIPCDFYPDRPQGPVRAFGGPLGDGKPKNRQGVIE